MLAKIVISLIHLFLVQIWDTAGQEKFRYKTHQPLPNPNSSLVFPHITHLSHRTMTVSTFKGSKAVLIGYDVSNKKSFEEVLVWIRETERFMGGEEPLIILFGMITLLFGTHCS